MNITTSFPGEISCHAIRKDDFLNCIQCRSEMTCTGNKPQCVLKGQGNDSLTPSRSPGLLALHCSIRIVSLIRESDLHEHSLKFKKYCQQAGTYTRPEPCCPVSSI